MCLDRKPQGNDHQKDIKKKVLISNDKVDDLLHSLLDLYETYEAIPNGNNMDKP